MSSAQDLQRDYYTRTAAEYDRMHVLADDEHYAAMRFLAGLMPTLGVASLLDVGAGTGRTLDYMSHHLPGLKLHGIEPVQSLLDLAVKKGVPASLLSRGSGEALPFPDGAFDAVCEFGVLHHVPHPHKVVAEMLRVARKAVFISDCNRFGQGRPAVRFAKLILYKIGLWNPLVWLRNGGKMHMVSDAEGISYSYSVYDSQDQVARWADRLMVIPTGVGKPRGWMHPLLTNSHVLLCGLRDDRPVNTPRQPRP